MLSKEQSSTFFKSLWGLKGFSRRGHQCGVWRFLGSQVLRARLCCRKISDSIFWLFCFTPRWLGRCNALSKEGPQEIYKGKDRNRQETKNFSFILSFIYLVNGLTNATSKDIAWCPKHQIVKSVLSVRRHYPKRDRFTENLSIYLFTGSKFATPKSSNFGATASHWLLYILLFFFFLILTGWMRGALCVATRLYFLYLAADESISGWEFFLLIPKSPQVFGMTRPGIEPRSPGPLMGYSKTICNNILLGRVGSWLRIFLPPPHTLPLQEAP